jgi:hypothetical protein
MNGKFTHIPLDHPYLDRYQNAHIIDGDAVSSRLAFSIAEDAYAAGHPADPEAAPRTLAGPSGAAAVQVAMTPYVQKAVDQDQAAEQYSAGALQHAQDAREAAERRRDLPHERVQLTDGSSRTRGQVHVGHDERVHATAQRESRGDFEHNQSPPGLPARLLVVPVLALIEMFLLIWPVTDASWADIRSVAYFVGLAVMFVFMNEKLPKLAGQAIRDAREARHGARELTVVGVTASREGDTRAGRGITGHAMEWFVNEAERKMVLCCAPVGVAIAVYAAVMATRVVRLAAPLGSPLFAWLAAALITAFTAGALIFMVRWWSRGNALGDQHREHGILLDESRALAEQLANQSRDALIAAYHAAEEAERHLKHGDQTTSDGVQYAGKVLQKAAKILGLDSVHTPRPENLLPVERPIRSRAVSTLDWVAASCVGTRELLSAPHPFPPAGPAPNPWEIRTRPRHALPNPVFIDYAQLGPLHDSGTERRTWPRGRTVLLTVAVVVTFAAIAATLVLL